MSETATADRTPLDEVMLAMDVVDTLRHRDRIVDRELAAEDREEQLMQRLREIYAGQGIEVSDEVLAQGVRGLRENRFVYPAPEPGLGRSLAKLYVSRERWGKWVLGAAALAAAAMLGYQLLVRGPELRAVDALPPELRAAHQSIVDLTGEPAALSDAMQLLGTGETALARGDSRAAREAVAGLQALGGRLEQSYELRVVSRPGELSGVWRVPDANSAAQNYYLIVEPIAANGETLVLPVRSEEDGRVQRVSKWALRVDEQTFQDKARDKRDDGIIQNALVAVKRRGALEPEYLVPTSGAAITEW